MTRLNISLLGRMEYHYPDSKHKPYRRSLRLALLAYLIQQKRAFSRKYLSELIWPTIDPDQSRTYLRNILQRLKVDFGPFLLVDQETIGFDVTQDCWIDTLIFEEAVFKFNMLGQRSTQDLLQEIDPFSDALSLYKGNFLASYSRPESVRFEAWLQGERDRLHMVAIKSYHTLLTLRLEHKQDEKGILDARRLLALEPFDELGHLCMMQFFVMNNELRRAQSTFERYETLLERDLGIAGLGDEIVALYKEIGRKLHARNVQGDLLFPPSFDRDKGRAAPPSNRPSLTTTDSTEGSTIEKSYRLYKLLFEEGRTRVTILLPKEGNLQPFFKMLQSRLHETLRDGAHILSTSELSATVLQNRFINVQSGMGPVRLKLIRQIFTLFHPGTISDLTADEMLTHIRNKKGALIIPDYVPQPVINRILDEISINKPTLKLIIGSPKLLDYANEISLDLSHGPSTGEERSA